MEHCTSRTSKAQNFGSAEHRKLRTTEHQKLGATERQRLRNGINDNNAINGNNGNNDINGNGGINGNNYCVLVIGLGLGCWILASDICYLSFVSSFPTPTLRPLFQKHCLLHLTGFVGLKTDKVNTSRYTTTLIIKTTPIDRIVTRLAHTLGQRRNQTTSRIIDR